MPQLSLWGQFYHCQYPCYTHPEINWALSFLHSTILSMDLNWLIWSVGRVLLEIRLSVVLLLGAALQHSLFYKNGSSGLPESTGILLIHSSWLSCLIPHSIVLYIIYYYINIFLFMIFFLLSFPSIVYLCFFVSSPSCLAGFSYHFVFWMTFSYFDCLFCLWGLFDYF